MTLPSQQPRTSGPWAYTPRKPRSVHFAAALIWAITLSVIIAGAILWGAV